MGARKDAERQLKRHLREAEGGRAGGFNDRQLVERVPVVEDDCEFDEFGRRKRVKAAAKQEVSKNERAKLALERLRQKAKGQGTEKNSGEEATKRTDEDVGDSSRG